VQGLKPQGDLFKELDKALVSQIWAEVVYHYRKGEKLMLSADTQKGADIAAMAVAIQEHHTEKHPWNGVVKDFLELPLCEDYYELGLYEKRAWLVEAAQTGVRLRSTDKPEEYGVVKGIPGEVGFWQHKGQRLMRRDRVTVHELWQEGLAGDIKNMTTQNTKYLHIAMRSDFAVKSGWYAPPSGKMKVNGQSVRGYLRKQL
jgi:predicted P-loop ATPase